MNYSLFTLCSADNLNYYPSMNALLKYFPKKIHFRFSHPSVGDEKLLNTNNKNKTNFNGFGNLFSFPVIWMIALKKGE